MKITRIEVKTYYEVSFSKDEINELLAKEVIYTNEPKELGHNGYFGIVQLTPNQANGIAHQLGYDGWHNIGIYKEETDTYRMTFYNNGDTLKR